MDLEMAHKQEMIAYIKNAVEYIEMAMNVVECDDEFNDGQSELLNAIYKDASKAWDILKTYTEG